MCKLHAHPSQDWVALLHYAETRDKASNDAYLRARFAAVHDRVAPVDLESIVEKFDALALAHLGEPTDNSRRTYKHNSQRK